MIFDTNKKNKLNKKQQKMEMDHFMKLLNDLEKIETMKKIINTTLFLKNEKNNMEKYILNAKIRTNRNLYWSGKLLNLESIIEDIPELIKKQEMQLKKMEKMEKKE